MRIIAFITAPAAVRQVLQHLGAPTRSPRCAPARGPPLWETVTAAPPADHDPRWDPAAQPLPLIEFDQRLTGQKRTFQRIAIPTGLMETSMRKLGAPIGS